MKILVLNFILIVIHRLLQKLFKYLNP